MTDSISAQAVTLAVPHEQSAGTTDPRQAGIKDYRYGLIYFLF